MESTSYEGKRMLSIPELAEELSIATSWLYERSRLNTLPGMRRVGRFLRIDRDEFYLALEKGELMS